MSLYDLARYYQQTFGFNLVPLGSDKRPVLTGGLSKSGKAYRFAWEDWQATPQPANFWDKCSEFTWWKAVRGLAVVCGINGLVCIDFDRASFDTVEIFLEALSLEDNDWIVQSPGGGYHVYIRCPDLSMPKGKIDRPGVDAAHIEIRHVGHYVALPGSAHPSGGTYLWRGQQPAKLPPVVATAALMLAYNAVTVQLPPKTPRLHTNGHSAPPIGPGSEITPAYVQQALDDELSKLAATPQGGRNHALNSAAFALGQLVADGVLAEIEVISHLEQTALSIGLAEDEIGATIESGLSAGKRQPRGLLLRQPKEPKTIFDWDATGGDWAEIKDAVGPKLFNLFDYSDEEGGVLDIWIEEHGEQWLYVPDETRWYEWTETHWQHARAETLGVQLQTLLRNLNALAVEALAEARSAEDKQDAEHALAWLNATRRTKARIFSIRYMAQEQRSESVNALNAGNALNCANGVLDLDNYTLVEHSPAQRFTYCLPYAYDPDADCPRWDQFCAEVFIDTNGNPDLGLIHLVQQAVGYSLTAETHHEAMFWLSGEGSNGKTVFLSILRALLGHMAIAIDFQQLGQPGNYDLASLPGKRVVVSTEAERGGGLAEGYIKRIVSGEIINARAIRGEPFEFKSNAKLWWAMNDKPTVKDTSNAIWRRLKLIEFRRIFTEDEKDTRLLEKLMRELPGILNWAIQGLKALRQAGRFQEPESMRRAREEYRLENNPVLQWLEENTFSAKGQSKSEWTKAKDAYEDYREWCSANGRQPYNSNNFGRELTRLKVEKDRLPGGHGMGYALRLVASGGQLPMMDEEILRSNGL